jgi:AcrR family transcriptional regulator
MNDVVPRRRARDRFPDLVAAAMRIFGSKGYRASQMADIAKEFGVSEAALYRYVDSKEALFRLVIREAFFLEPIVDEPLPLSSPSFEVTLKEIREHIEDATPPPALRAALQRRRVRDPGAELEEIIRELFVLTALTRQATDMIERSARELQSLAELVDVVLRRPLLEAMTAYLSARMRARHLRATPDAAATARLVVETVTWFARHRLHDPDGAAISDTLAEETVVDVLLHALVLPPTAARAR